MSKGRLGLCCLCNRRASKTFDRCACGQLVCPVCRKNGKHINEDGVHVARFNTSGFEVRLTDAAKQILSENDLEQQG